MAETAISSMMGESIKKVSLSLSGAADIALVVE